MVAIDVLSVLMKHNKPMSFGEIYETYFSDLSRQTIRLQLNWLVEKEILKKKKKYEFVYYEVNIQPKIDRDIKKEHKKWLINELNIFLKKVKVD